MPQIDPRRWTPLIRTRVEVLHGDPQASTPGETVGPTRPGDRVLDVSCGPGCLTNLVADAVRPAGTALGIDPSPTVIDHAKRNTTRENCSFELGTAEHLAAPDNMFDVVLSSLMVHHLRVDLRPRAFAEVLRVLHPGGRLPLPTSAHRQAD